MNYAIVASSPLLLNDTFYRKIWMFSVTQPKENEEATVSLFTTVHGRHHGLTVIFTGTELSNLLILHGHDISGASVGGQHTLK